MAEALPFAVIGARAVASADVVAGFALVSVAS
jgi:hypothetical protein